MAATYSHDDDRSPGRRLAQFVRIGPAILAAAGIGWATWHYRDSLATPTPADSRVVSTSAPAQSGAPAAETAAPGPMHPARAIACLQTMQQAYRNLTSYADRTQITLRARSSQERLEDHAELDVTWQQPDQLALRIVHGQREFQVAADNGIIQSRMDDPQYAALSDQLASRHLSGALHLADVARILEVIDPSEPDARHSALATLPAPISLTPLALLLDPEVIDRLIQGARRVELLPDSFLRGAPAQRVQIESDQGVFVLWIAESSGLLRRIDQSPSLADPSEGQPTVTIEISDIEIQRGHPPAAFRFHAPLQAQRVRHFVLPPDQRAPQQLGSLIRGLEFTDLEGHRVTSDAWQDQVAVLVWFSRHDASQGVLAEVEQFATRTPAPEKCFIMAICTEPTTEMSHQDVADLKRQWSLSIKMVRDLAAVGRDVLGIERAPTLAVLDRHQRLQRLQEGGDQQLDEALVTLLERLLRDEDVASADRAEIERRWSAFDRVLAEAMVPEDIHDRHGDPP